MNVSISKRCRLFEQISADVWNSVSRLRRNNVQPQEVGITAFIIAEIRDAYSHDNHVGVWANNAYNEHIHGSDIDIFVEAEPGQFVWYPMQAKALKLSGRYDSMCHNNQWDKLDRLGRLGGAMPYFLLYNGDDNYQYVGSDACNRSFRQNQFGCSIVDTSVVRSKSLSDEGCTPPRFEDFHPELAEPWRVLTCCFQPRAATRYSYNQIKVYTEPYRLLSEELPLGMELEEEFLHADGEGSNKLWSFAKEIEHEPGHILLFRRTSLHFN